MAKNKNDPKALKRFLSDLERLAASLMILRAGINERIERYGKGIAALEKGEDLHESDSPLQVSLDEKTKAVDVLRGDVYKMIPRLRSNTLLRLNSALSGGGATYEYDLITVEHVLPRNSSPASQWEM